MTGISPTTLAASLGREQVMDAYRAGPGPVIVVQAGDVDYAMAGGNVCAVAQRRGIGGFVSDGMIRDAAAQRPSGPAVQRPSGPAVQRPSSLSG